MTFCIPAIHADWCLRFPNQQPISLTGVTKSETSESIMRTNILIMAILATMCSSGCGTHASRRFPQFASRPQSTMVPPAPASQQYSPMPVEPTPHAAPPMKEAAPLVPGVDESIPLPPSDSVRTTRFQSLSNDGLRRVSVPPILISPNEVTPAPNYGRRML